MLKNFMTDPQYVDMINDLLKDGFSNYMIAYNELYRFFFNYPFIAWEDKVMLLHDGLHDLPTTRFDIPDEPPKYPAEPIRALLKNLRTEAADLNDQIAYTKSQIETSSVNTHNETSAILSSIKTFKHQHDVEVAEILETWKKIKY
jgi:hypothetical protein